MKWFIIERTFGDSKFLYVGRGKQETMQLCKYSIDEVIDISNNFKYTYKAAQPFRKSQYDGKYVLYIFSDIDLDDDVISFLNNLNIFKIINNLNILTLYNIRDKIEMI